MTRTMRLLLLAAALVTLASGVAPPPQLPPPPAALARVRDGQPPGCRRGRREGQVVATVDPGGAPSGTVTAAAPLWVSLGVDGIARIDPATNQIVARIRPGGVSLAAGFGSIWAVDIFADVLLRIDPGNQPDHRSDPRRGDADRDRDRPRLRLGRQPARLDRLPSLARNRPDGGDDPAGQGRDLAGRDRRDIGRGLGGRR